MRSRRRLSVAALVLVVAAGGARALATGSTQALYKDAAQPIPKRVDDLLGRMTLAEKVGQMTQVDRGFLNTPADITTARSARCSAAAAPCRRRTSRRRGSP